MSDDLTVFRDLVLWIWQTHEKPWDYKDEKAQKIVEKANLLISTFYDVAELEAKLPSENDVSTSFGNRHFYLTPITESKIMVPRIQLKCDFGRNVPEIRCRLELFLLKGNVEDSDDGIEIKYLGYRFESPEGQNIEGAGLHNYYHIQIIQPPMGKVDWLPDTQPAFPIDADDPVKLILCLLVSLYGLDYLGIILRDAHNITELSRYIDGVPHKRSDPFEWYRLVSIGDPAKHHKGYRIKSDLNGFQEHINGKYAGCKHRGITPSAFNALKDQNEYPE